ncbi:hypothetical protein [Psychrobacillus antarcticus]|uniref:hypothetical protein n=1 Tax=Psychrobacillus antarcticus TaxID=2879115 RepID=UPI0024081CBA|nr:hypothetical protein [Psychrobacillus antarcticus]
MSITTWMIVLLGLLPAIIGVSIVLYLIKKLNLKGKFHLNKITTITYFSLLIACGVIYEIIPKEPTVDKLSNEQLVQLQTENNSFQKSLLKLEENKLNQKFLKEEWSHEINGNTLSLEYKGNEIYSTRVFVEWMETTDQIIEGKVYRSNLNVYGLNLDQKVPLHRVEWTGNQLVIHEPSVQELSFDRFSNRLYSFNQVLYDEEIRMVRGQTYIHLKVPKHIEIVDPLGLQMY